MLKKEKQIGRREFYADVLAEINAKRLPGNRIGVNPAQTILRKALKVLAQYDKETINRIVHGR